MKKLLAAVSLVSFGGVLLIISVLVASQARVAVAQSTDSEVMEEEVVVDEMVGPVDYYLPYPGILPDHPLYWLKMVRDRISLWLTRQPAAKVEKLLLYADKRIGAARVLWEGNQIDLAVTTATKAEKYMEQVVGELERFSGEIEREATLVERVDRATAKHEELLTVMLQRADEASAKIIRESLELLENGKARLNVLKEQRGLGNTMDVKGIMEEVSDSGEAMEASGRVGEQPVELQGTL